MALNEVSLVGLISLSQVRPDWGLVIGSHTDEALEHECLIHVQSAEPPLFLAFRAVFVPTYPSWALKSVVVVMYSFLHLTADEGLWYCLISYD